MVVIMRPDHTAEELNRAIRVMEAGGVNVMISRGSETTILGAEGDGGPARGGAGHAGQRTL